MDVSILAYHSVGRIWAAFEVLPGVVDPAVLEHRTVCKLNCCLEVFASTGEKRREWLVTELAISLRIFTRKDSDF
jgi:hypothetical protein